MNILRLSTLSLTLAIAVFALSLAIPTVAAPKKCEKNPDAPGCGGEDETETVFSVEMQSGTVGGADGLVTSNGDCGITEGARNDNVRIPDGCVPGVEVYFTTGPTGGPLTLTAFSLGVRFNKLDMHIFFTDGQIISGHNTGDVYVSERLPVTIIPDGSSPSGSTPFTVKVNLSGLYVIKSHQPRKGDLVGPIAIGEIVYTPIE